MKSLHVGASARATAAKPATTKRKRKDDPAGAGGAPKPEKKRVAFEVTEEHEGHAEIVWAKSSAEARRIGGSELNREFNEVRTKRVPELDGFKGDIYQWKFDHGWWSSCHYQKCFKERCGEGDGAVYIDGIWCCSEEHVRLEKERRVEEKVLKQAAADEAIRLKPGSTVHSVHFNPDGIALIDMTFPSDVRRTYTFLDWLASEEGQRA